MSIRLATLMVTGLTLVVLSTGCDAFAEYTVANHTDEELLTWPLLEDCRVVIGKEDDYLHAEVVKPRERHAYFDAYSPALPDPGCVQVATLDRRLVLAEKYEYGGTYTVAEPLRPFGDPVPEPEDLPGQSLKESFREMPPIYFAYLGLELLLGLGIAAALLSALFFTVRHFYRHYRGTP